VIPKKEHGGRYGRYIYMRLEEIVCFLPLLRHRHIIYELSKGDESPEEFPWVARHPWESWKGRYKNHATRLDTLIKHYVRHEPPSERLMYYRRRGWSSKHQRIVAPGVSDEEDENLDSDNDNAETVNVHPETRPLHTKRRRPSNFGNSQSSAAPAKRQRTAALPLARTSDSLDFRARSKGKKKAAPSDDDNNELPHKYVSP
jgi:hypothetical protein